MEKNIIHTYVIKIYIYFLKKKKRIHTFQPFLFIHYILIWNFLVMKNKKIKIKKK